MADSSGRYERLTAEQMDEQRIQNVAYQYLCRLEEAKRWMEACLGEELPAPSELEEALRNGVFLAKLGHRFAPNAVALKKIYDPEQLRYQAAGLQFRHTDNINHWRNAMTTLGLPAIFHPETTDVYDRKNMPRAVYCIHALSLYLYRLGLAPQIQDLYGKVKFTEEEINNMKSELDKYGIQMPAFNKIGGILANELSVDEAAAHAAVIAINEAVDRGQVAVTAAALRNPNAQLAELQDALMAVYQEMLQQHKNRKRHAANRGGGPEEKDIYEEFLTQREIQNNINLVNVRWAVEQVDEALDSADELSLLSALQLPCLALRGLRTENSPWYLDQLSADRQQKALEEGCVDPLDPDELQEAVTLGNQEAHRARTVDAALQKVNESLRLSDPRHTVSCLMTSDLQLPQVFPFAASLYHRELQLLQRQSTQGELQQEELFVAVEMLSAVALINQALEAGRVQQFSCSLVSPSAGLSDVEDSLLDRYFECLVGWKRKQLNGDLLTWNQLQEGINSVNNSAQDEHQQVVCVRVVNEAVLRGDRDQLLSALLLPSCGAEDVLPENIWRYLTLLQRAREHRAKVSRDPGAELWLADIQEAVTRANQQSQKALKMCLSLAAVNQAVKENRESQTLRVLSLPQLQLQEVLPVCAAEYQRELLSLITQRTLAGDNRSPWVRVRLDDGSFFFLDLKRLQGGWEKPNSFVHNSVFLDRQQIQEVVSGVSGSYSRSVLWRSSESLLVRLQAASRGFLLRQKLQARRRYLSSHTPAVIIIQSHWRRFVQQGAYRRRLQFLYMNWRAVVKIQAFVKMWLARRKYRARLSFFRRHVGAVIKIQAFFRANRAREEYRMLVHSATPPLSVVRKFVHLLDRGDGDITEEAELLRLREEVVRSIRFNRQLETDLTLMDLKIGLLVRNRATLQEVVSHCKKLTKKNKEQLSDMMDVERSKGLKALSRERRERLEAYQHLFYLLQTQPLYLAQLIFLMPQSRSTSFMEMLVFSLFNYGSDCRDAFLLLQLFTAALTHEIREKVEQPQDIVTGNPTVIKMLVNFYRHARGQNSLRESLGPALQDVLLDRTLSIRTDPVDVYKTWINQTETQTGHKSSLPYEVSPADALSHPEVQRRIDIAIINLKNLTDRVLKAITSNLHKLPYGLRYTAKVLRDALKAKFPEASEDELYKIVGNLVYYRYMNPAVVAPDGFDVVDRSAGSALQPEQRHILGSIARMLQHAAANKHFHGDGYHVRALNQYISQTHSKFRKFLVCVCDVPEPEDRFNMDEYSELLIVNKPVVYISVSELLNTHTLLLDHQEVLCPDPSNPLRLLLNDLGSVPTLQELTGESSSSADPGSEVSLTLTNKFDIFNESEDKPDVRGLLLSTKQLIIDVIRTQSGDSLRDMLRTSVSHDQEACHDWLMQRRARQDDRTPDKMKRNESLVANGNLSLEEKKRKILRCLRRLEGLGVLRAPNPENQILQMIAKDIRQQRVHRQRRGAELQKLHQTLSSLQDKSSFHSQQVDYYRHYITSCLDNLTHSSKSTNKKKLPALSYSAARLQEKGVLLEIQDLPATQFKNVVFDIVPGPEKGTFNVKARFLGIEMEEFPLKYQDLLQLQYEGVAVMKMFDKAKINVNLLIFLLNKKFFKK
ncbi:ras GTPase-activating-like protein IQGAP3 isoform X2 [Sander lucioperca]|uniref:ras GTPase-activating-like protein IQGAP3 isoform X1 n=1 Tax=Sander lucioperca TaxID=283035 RepID=UPI00125DF8E8|nr:ras GTPase-activating-like protein IQGAP3 isoform X1 [Sander lucioperca]XP_035862008.1 ras GTPase-activating-like protein IQGAP3 isoform X2 [Sander lucioperca]